MADIFDTSQPEGRSIQQGVGGVGITPQGRSAGTSISPEDTFNLRADTRLSQLRKINDTQRFGRESTKIAAEPDNHLANLARGVISRYTELDNTIRNPIERNRLKRETDLIAMTSAGKGNTSFIKDILGRLNTKREARSDGMVNVLGSNGEVIGIEAGSADEVLKGRMNIHQEKINEVFPNTLDSFSTLLAKDSVAGNHIGRDTMASIITSMKDQAGKMKGISDNYHVLSNQLPTSQHAKLVDTATTGYMSSIGDLFNSFTTADMLKAVRAGTKDGLNRSDIEIAMQQVRRDVIEEITSQQIPVPMQDIEAYIKSSIDNINSTYDNISTNDLIPLETAKKKATLINELARQRFKTKHNIPELEGAKPAIDFMSTIAATTADFTDAAQFGTKDDKALYTELAKGSRNLIDGLMPVFDGLNKHFYQSSFDLDDVQTQINSMETREDYSRVLTKLSKVTNHSNGWALGPQVRGLMNTAIISMQGAVEANILSKEESEVIIGQFFQYDQHVKDMTRKAGMTEDDFFAQQTESIGFFESTWNSIFPPASNEPLTIPKSKAQRGSTNENK